MITLLPRISDIACGSRLFLTDGRTVDVKRMGTPDDVVFEGKVVGYIRRERVQTCGSHRRPRYRTTFQYALVDEPDIWRQDLMIQKFSLVRTVEALLRGWEAKEAVV